jgi:hypothetical protein
LNFNTYINTLGKRATGTDPEQDEVEIENEQNWPTYQALDEEVILDAPNNYLGRGIAPVPLPWNWTPAGNYGQFGREWELANIPIYVYSETTSACTQDVVMLK